jgi:hypothetical protein
LKQVRWATVRVNDDLPLTVVCNKSAAGLLNQIRLESLCFDDVDAFA